MTLADCLAALWLIARPVLEVAALVVVALLLARWLHRTTPPAPPQRPDLRVIRGDAPRRADLTDPTWPDDDGPYPPTAA